MTATWGSCSTSSTSWVSPRTRSWSTAPTTARTPTAGLTAPPRLSAARRPPTGRARHGDPNSIEKLKTGHKVSLRGEDKEFKVHLDAFNLLPYLTGEVDKSPRRGMIYFSDDCDVLGVSADNWKVVFMEQRCPGTLRIWFEPFTALRAPKLFNLRTDPFERGDITSNTYWDWFMERDFLAFMANALVLQFLETFKEFPPRQRAASFTINNAVEQLENFLAGK